MPQKRNPDAAELIRAKPGRIVGALNGLLLTLKGLPLAYSKDMQEDKEPVFLAADTLGLSLAAMTGMIADLHPRPEIMRAAAEGGFLTATDLADWLVMSLKMPFREAHHVTGRAVRRAEELSLRLPDLPLAELQAIEPRITADVFAVLSVEASAHRRQSYGGTAPDQVRAAVARARARLLV